MMRRAKRSVCQSAPHRDDFYICVVIANVVAHLLQAPQNWKVGNRIRKYNLPAQRHTCRDSGHILLGHSAVQKSLGKPPREFLDHSESEISHNKIYSLVLLGQFEQCAKESSSHSSAPNSTIALLISSWSGDR